jgi:hypothetical protein
VRPGSNMLEARAAGRTRRTAGVFVRGRHPVSGMLGSGRPAGELVCNTGGPRSLESISATSLNLQDEIDLRGMTALEVAVQYDNVLTGLDLTDDSALRFLRTMETTIPLRKQLFLWPSVLCRHSARPLTCRSRHRCASGDPGAVVVPRGVVGLRGIGHGQLGN